MNTSGYAIDVAISPDGGIVASGDTGGFVCFFLGLEDGQDVAQDSSWWGRIWCCYVCRLASAGE